MKCKLVEHVKYLDNLFFGLTWKQLMALAFQFAEMNNLQHRFNPETRPAGNKRARSFLKRSDLSLRTAQLVSVAHAMAFNPVQVAKFFENLGELYKKHHFQPARIFNMDETGITTAPPKSPRVVTKRGKKKVQKITSADRGQTIKAVCCVSASGIFIPPAMIFATMMFLIQGGRDIM